MTTRKGIPCGLYIRVSTDKQAAKEFNSLETQEDLLQKLVKEKNARREPGSPEWYVEETYKEARSAKDTYRPEFKRLMSDVAQGRIKMILFLCLDRLSRSVRDFLNIQEDLRKHGCRFVSLRDPLLDTSSVHGELITLVLLALAQYERKLTSVRTIEKMRWRAEKGLWNGGTVPLGYKHDPHKKGVLAPDDEEAKLVRLIFKKYIELGSVNKLVMFLKEHGYSAPESRRRRRTDEEVE